MLTEKLRVDLYNGIVLLRVAKARLMLTSRERSKTLTTASDLQNFSNNV